MAEPTVSVMNHDILGIVTRLDRFVVELIKSASSGVSAMSTFDQARLEAYLNNINKYLAHVEAQPQLDLPESHPTQYSVPALIPQTLVENPDVADIVRLLNLARVELTDSQSARIASGLIAPDSSRFKAIIGKVEKFLKDFIQAQGPLDLPESSPMIPLSGPGRTGV